MVLLLVVASACSRGVKTWATTEGYTVTENGITWIAPYGKPTRPFTRAVRSATCCI